MPEFPGRNEDVGDVRWIGGVKAFIGPEIVVHALPSKDPRASVIDAFVRADFQANGRGVETYDQLVLGARYLLDVF